MVAVAGKMFILAIPGEGDGGKPMAALDGVDKFKEIAFPTGPGKFSRTPVAFMYLTTPHRNEERIDCVKLVHCERNGKCAECNRPYPCRTVRLLNGETP